VGGEVGEEVGNRVEELLGIEQICQGEIEVFKGQSSKCRLACAETGGSNCCSTDETWVGLGKCTEREEALHKMRDQDKTCHLIGTYCSKKVMGVCMVRKKASCCFDSVLAKIYHEQGRPQLDIKWGKPKKPNCRGFTIEEFQKIDASDFDFSEWTDSYMGDMLGGINEQMDDLLKEGIKFPDEISNLDIDNLTKGDDDEAMEAELLELQELEDQGVE